MTACWNYSTEHLHQPRIVGAFLCLTPSDTPLIMPAMKKITQCHSCTLCAIEIPVGFESAPRYYCSDRRQYWLNEVLKTGPRSTQGSSEIAEKALKDAGYDAFYSDFNGKIMLGENLEKELSELPLYATDGAEYGTQDSELIAECIRFVFVHGFGKNGIADAIAKAFV